MIVLAIEGKQFPSEKFSQTIDQIMTSGYSNLTFVIGGSLGLSPEAVSYTHLDVYKRQI